jgi:hypothetical protein
MLEESVSGVERQRREEALAERRERGFAANFESEGDEGDSEKVFNFSWSDDEEEESAGRTGERDSGTSGESAGPREGQRFRVQAGVFSQEENARQRAAQLKRLLFAPEIMKEEGDTGTYYAVVVGTFRSREQAERLIGELEDNGFDASLKILE